MKYYKIIQNDIFIGVGNSSDFIRYQQRNHYYVTADETNGEFIVCNGRIYRSSWMSPVSNESTVQFEEASVIEISEEEYNSYAEMIENNEVIEL